MLEHVHYEIDMLTWGLLVDSVGVKLLDGVQMPQEASEACVSNALIELRALHGRNLAEFLTSRRSGRHAVVARDYLPDFKLDKAHNRKLDHLWVRAGREVAHITTERVTDAEQAQGDKDKRWQPSMFVTLLQVLSEFLLKILSEWLEHDSKYRQRCDLALSNVRQMLLIRISIEAGGEDA
jgi:hypothetical protein